MLQSQHIRLVMIAFMMDKGKKKPWGTTSSVPELQVRIDVQVFCLWANSVTLLSTCTVAKRAILILLYWESHACLQAGFMEEGHYIVGKANIASQPELVQEEQVPAWVPLFTFTRMEDPASFQDAHQHTVPDFLTYNGSSLWLCLKKEIWGIFKSRCITFEFLSECIGFD